MLMLETNSLFFLQIGRYWFALLNHVYSRWYRFFLGKVGIRTVIRRHCQLEGDCLKAVCIGDYCVIDTNCVIGCRSRLVVQGKKIQPELKIGSRCNLGQYSHITAVNKVIIGDNLLTGRFVLITDNSHGGFSFDELQVSPSKRPVVSKGEVIIGNNVWLGDKVSVLPGVHIGDGCIIGANSVVTHDIPANSLAVGNPAKVIKSIHSL